MARLDPAAHPHLPTTFTRVKQILATGCNSRSLSLCLLLKGVKIHFIRETFTRCCDATLVCVQNDVTAGSPANYKQTANKLSEPKLTSATPLSICTFTIGCFSRKKKLEIIFEILLILFQTESECFSSRLMVIFQPHHFLKYQ